MKATGRALALLGLPPAVLDRLGGSLGEAARAAAGELGREPATRGAREVRLVRAAWAAAVRVPVPGGVRGVHASWLEAGLAPLPARARSDVATGGGDPVGVWLARWACAELVPLPPADRAAPPHAVGETVRLADDQLARWLAHVGADQVAHALGPAGPEALAGAVRAAGERVRAAAARIGSAPRAGHLGPVRAAIARCQLALSGRALVMIGARAIAPHVDARTGHQLALRLERPLGLAVRAELAAWADAPVAQAPDWLALGAPLR